MLTFPLCVSVRFPDSGKRLRAGKDAPRRHFVGGKAVGGVDIVKDAYKLLVLAG